MTHRARVGYLVAGLIFIGLAVSWLLHETGTVHGVRWLFPTVLLGAGIAGLAVSVIGSFLRSDPVLQPAPAPRAESGTEPEPPAGQPDGQPQPASETSEGSDQD